MIAICHAANPPDEPAAGFEIRSETGDVLIAADQIRSYDRATHTLTVAPKVRKRLAGRPFRERIVSGIPFTVTVDGQAIYEGAFTSIVSSRSFSTPMIVIDAQRLMPALEADQLRIQLGYPSDEFFEGDDPRADPRIDDALSAAGKMTDSYMEHSKWIEQVMREMQAIKKGTTREDLLKVFREEGGLSTRSTQRYVYRGCPYIKVKTEFEPVGALDDKLTKFPQDKIARISAPFLEWSIND